MRTREGGLGPLSDPMGRNKVKPEQASKVLMRMPTLRSFGGRPHVWGKQSTRAPTRSARGSEWARHVGRVVRSYRGRPVADEGSGLSIASGGGWSRLWEFGRGNRSVDAAGQCRRSKGPRLLVRF